MAISNYLKALLNRMNSSSFKAGLGTLIQALQTASAANTAALNSKSVLYSAIVTTGGGAAAEDVTIAGVLATDQCYVELSDDGTNNVTIAAAACDAGKVTITFSGDPGADAIVNLLVIR